MDYLIAGLGLGAVLAIIGFFLRELGLSHRRSFPRWIPELGAALMVSALIVWVVTAAAFFLGMEDDAALQVVLGSVAAGALGSLVATAIMARMRKPRVVQAAVHQAAQFAEPVPTETVASEPEVEPAPAPEPAEADVPAVEPDVVPATEKNWEEIWRQTWGSEAVRKLVPDAAVEGPSDDSARPIDLAVLETWETPVEESGPPGEAREVPDIAAELPESSTVTPGGHEAEDPDPVSEAAADSVDNDASTADGSDLDSLDTTDDSPIPNAGSLNGSEPDSDWEPSVEPADLTDTPGRDHR